MPLKILLAEDNELNQKVLLELLKRLGYKADTVGNGLEALEALRRQSYDLVLMDLHMPEMDGLTATLQISQEWPPQSRPRIIAVTADTMPETREACLSAGMDGYITKPIRVEILATALSQCQSQLASPAAVEVESPSPPTTPILDPTTFQELTEILDEDEILAKVIDSYLEDAPKLLQAIATAVAQGDAKVLEDAAHTLKSTSATFGATNLHQFCWELERIGRSGTLTASAEMVSQVETEYEKVKVALLQKRPHLDVADPGE
ncbi:MAG: response regulator [Xenococcaceae cyanobacterium]